RSSIVDFPPRAARICARCGGAQRVLGFAPSDPVHVGCRHHSYVSRIRAQYLWLGALGGIALMLTPLTTGPSVGSPFWLDVICVAVFVGITSYTSPKAERKVQGQSRKQYRAR